MLNTQLNVKILLVQLWISWVWAPITEAYLRFCQASMKKTFRKIVNYDCTKNEEILNGKLHFLCSVYLQIATSGALWKIGVPKIFANFTGKNLCLESLFNAVASLQAWRTPILKNICERLLLIIDIWQGDIYAPVWAMIGYLACNSCKV